MNENRPHFECKELALSSSPYVYLPVNINTYAVEVTHRDEINGEMLQEAVNRTLKRMPYLSDTMQIEHGAVYYAVNPLPFEVGHTSTLRRVGGAETNYHMLDLTWDGNITWFSMFHGFCDGQGINAFIESVLYYYYCMKDDVEYESEGIRTDKVEMTDAEVVDPCDSQYSVSPDFQMPDRGESLTPYHLTEIVQTPGNEVLEYGFHIPSEEFMNFVRANGTSPAVAFSMLVGEAIQKEHPDLDAPVVVNIPISIRKMLGCEETFKNCSSRAVLPVLGTPLDQLPFGERAATLRGVLKQQMNPDLYHAIYNRLGSMYRQRMEAASDYQEEIKKPAGFMTVCHDTFYIDYIGRFHNTGYSDNILDVRFLCQPAARNTLHLNVIEHSGKFRISCLACSDIASLADKIGEVMEGHGLTVECIPECRFQLPATDWR